MRSQIIMACKLVDYSTTDTEPDTNNETNDANDVKKRSSTSRPMTWKQNINKKKRCHAEAYKSKRGTEMPPRTMGPPCTSNFCKQSSSRQCNNFTEKDRQEIFDYFWSYPDWRLKMNYVRFLVDKTEIKQKIHLKIQEDTPRSFTICRR